MWGGVTSAGGTARHRRCRRQVRHPDGQGHRRPAHRSARRQEGGPAGRLGRPQRRGPGLRPRLRQGAAHGEDLRRLRMVPLRHAGFDRAWGQAREIPVGLLDAAQGQDRRVGLSAQLRRSDDQGCRRRLRRQRLRHRLRRRRWPRHPGDAGALPRLDRGRDDRDRRGAFIQLYREEGRYLERIDTWAKRVGVDSIKAQVVDDVDKRRALYARFVFSQRFAQNDPWAERVGGKTRTSSRPSPTFPSPPDSPHDRSDLDGYRRARPDPAPGRACSAHGPTAASRCSAPWTTASSRSKTAARTEAGL